MPPGASLLDHRHQLVPETIADDRDVLVRLVLAKRKRPRREITPQRPAAEVEERPDDTTPRRGRMPARPRVPAPRQQPHQHRLGLVVGRVRGDDGVGAEPNGSLGKPLVTNRARGDLDRGRVGARPRCDVDSRDLDRHAELRRQRAAERFVGVGRLTAELVIDVNEAREFARAGVSELAQNPRQRDGVGAAG